MDCAGVTSSVDLTNKDFTRIMNRFKALGYVPNIKGFREIDNLPEGDRRVMRKINAIRLDLKKTWEYVDGIAKKQTGIANVMWVKGKELNKVLQALVIHQNRVRKRKGN